MIEDFYPTPRTLISKMLKGVKFDRGTDILEPSAGKGDICDAIRKRFEYSSSDFENIDVIEINPDLQATLRGKGYNLIQDDFLTFETSKCYDLIIANFPFSNGDEHLIHAIELVRDNGGQLVCLVNAETIHNSHTQQRDMLRRWLETFGASIEFLSAEFKDSERPTGVEVALVRLKIEKVAGESFILDSLTRAEDQSTPAATDTSGNIVERDFIRAMIARFRLECQAGVRLINEWSALAPHILSRHKTKDDDRSDYRTPLITVTVKGTDSRYDDSGRTRKINEYLPLVREKYWTVLINDPRYTGQYTSNILEDLNQKLNELKKCDFNLFNIEQLAKDLELRVTKGVEEAILKLFDKLSTKFAWDESIHQKNVHYYNGWKTNKAWKVNRKVILPMNGISATYSSTYRWEYRIHDELADMVKAFNYLSPEKRNVQRLVGHSMNQAEQIQNFANVDFRYFKATFYKKRSCHITFLDQDLLDKFNIFGSQRKGWLPPAYGKAAYDEMNTEAQTVVDDFQGREAYEMVLDNTDYYLVEDARALLGNGENE